jgi:RNA polymerase sigma factor (sigma-70 family)
MAFGKKGKGKAAQAALSSVPEAISETAISEADVSELEASKLYSEDPLEALLDEQSDEDFGDLELKERAGKPVKLAEWSAQDFSSIYLRFRPHLERHARRFLRNPSQVDEVVQDAFLYLMVSLPELDSEIGVLRFLKWKTRLLALDVIRASGRAYTNSINDVAEPESKDPEVSSALEQQDDAAVVRLALSKLNPRHREVLIASMYEEKTTDEIAKQVGLSENATRQLIFRARAAFKKALIGDVDTSGMSAAAILSVAARKAASEGKKVGAAALTLIALFVMSLTVFPSLNRAPSDQMAEPSDSSSVESGTLEVLPTPTNGIVDDATAEATDPAGSSAADGDGLANDSVASSGSSDSADEGASSNESQASAAPADTGSRLVLGTTPTPRQSQAAQINQALAKVFDSRTPRSSLFVLDETYTATSPKGISATFVFNPTKDEPFKDVSGVVTLDGVKLTVYPDQSEWLSATDPQGFQRLVYFGTMAYVVDESGKILSDTTLSDATLRIEVVMNKDGKTVKELFVGLISKG